MRSSETVTQTSWSSAGDKRDLGKGPVLKQLGSLVQMSGVLDLFRLVCHFPINMTAYAHHNQSQVHSFFMNTLKKKKLFQEQPLPRSAKKLSTII